MSTTSRRQHPWTKGVPERMQRGTNQNSYNLIPSYTRDLPIIQTHIQKSNSNPFPPPTFPPPTLSNPSDAEKSVCVCVREREMASTACFLHPHALSTTHSRTPSQRFPSHIKPPSVLVCKAQKQAAHDEASDAAAISRRFALTILVGGAAIGTKVSPADAAFGEAANIFGKPKTNTDYLPYSGDGFKIQIPAKWNPSKEVEFPGQVLRYEDNFDSNSSVSVIVVPTTKKSITEYGSPEEFLSQVDFLFGKQAYAGKTDSEGGFETDAVATANILETATPVVGGKQYYFVSVLTRTADGDEGGKHQLVTAAVKDGKLYICKAQAGDKRWFKGARKFVEYTASSFNVA